MKNVRVVMSVVGVWAESGDLMYVGRSFLEAEIGRQVVWSLLC